MKTHHPKLTRPQKDQQKADRQAMAIRFLVNQKREQQTVQPMKSQAKFLKPIVIPDKPWDERYVPAVEIKVVRTEDYGRRTIVNP